MTDEQFAEWGKKEWAIRKHEMALAKTESEFSQVQKRCAERRREVGFSAGQAAKAVLVAQRLERGEALSFAMR